MEEDRTKQIIEENPEGPASAIGAPHEKRTGRAFLLAGLGALGVVYGDIGTSPLYALRECFTGEDSLPPSTPNVLGVLSLIFWALVIVISVKYLTYIMQADNRGEGGILALLALLNPWRGPHRDTRRLLILLGVFGAALLYGDGMITPAISVLSAVEGLTVATPIFTPYILPITVAILVLLFYFQKRGTGSVGAVFGPIMLLWFATLAALGVAGIVQRPEVFRAVSPLYGVHFFAENGWRGFLILGTVFLVVTGGEALYADIGHFGVRPIRLAWFAFVLPALLLNYFGQGALMLGAPEKIDQPFYRLAPDWALYPLVVLATVATVIASQAVISGAFSLTRQAVLLGEFPRLRIVQTSSEEVGQVYIPSINWVLMAATIALVLGFRSSGNLAAAYGVAVTTTMVITTLLAFFVAREKWQWSLPVALLVTAGFLVVDLAFFGANMLKIADGGWFPLVVGLLVFTLMTTWKRGRTLLAQQLQADAMADDAFLKQLRDDPPHRVPGTAVMLTARPDGVPPLLIHHLEHNQVLHEQVVIVTVLTEEVPRVSGDRLTLETLGQGLYRLVIHYGFMETPDVPGALRRSSEHLPDADVEEVTYYVGRDVPIPTEKIPGMALWREKLFAFMARNAAQMTSFFGIPPRRVVELGSQVEI